jgi:hypothetical protein
VAGLAGAGGTARVGGGAGGGRGDLCPWGEGGVGLGEQGLKESGFDLGRWVA